MRTEQEIRDKIEKLEAQSGKLLDYQQESESITGVYSAQKLRDRISDKIEQLLWVLNE